MEIKEAVNKFCEVALHATGAAALGYLGAHYVVGYNGIKAAKLCALAGAISNLAKPQIAALTKSYDSHAQTVGKMLHHAGGFMAAWGLYSYYAGVKVPYKAAAVLLGAVAVSAEAVKLLTKSF